MNAATKGQLKLGGAMTALITPMNSAGEVDLEALERLVRWQVESGIDGLVPCGTTGEGATLTCDERQRVIECVCRAADGRVPVVAGCGTNDTRTTLEGARGARSAGADALLVVSPYYNKPNRSGMIEHYSRVAGETELPVVVYNVPGRTGQNLGVDLMLELAAIPGVVAVKEAAGDLEQVGALLERRAPGFQILSGDDSLMLPALALGADGLISVVSNEAPAAMAAMIAAGRGGDFARARELHFRLLPLMRANFIESNPVPVKTAMALMGFCEEVLRAPLGPPTARTREILREALAAARIETRR